jgi:hypothetical protein
MISAKFNTTKFNKQMTNILKYSSGFMEGAKKGKTQLLNNIGRETIEVLKQYIDANARVDPQALHHIYEWYKTGSPAARLFDIDYTISNLGLSIKSTFRQSTSVKSGSKVPFYDKARIMENGIPVVIKPKNSQVLAFEDDGEEVFTKLPVYVENPGGQQAQGSYQRVFDSFFRNYFSQSFLRSSGILTYLKNAKTYKKNIGAGKTGGRSVGIASGYRWILNGRIN